MWLKGLLNKPIKSITIFLEWFTVDYGLTKRDKLKHIHTWVSQLYFLVCNYSCHVPHSYSSKYSTKCLSWVKCRSRPLLPCLQHLSESGIFYTAVVQSRIKFISWEYSCDEEYFQDFSRTPYYQLYSNETDPFQNKVDNSTIGAENGILLIWSLIS